MTRATANASGISCDHKADDLRYPAFHGGPAIAPAIPRHFSGDQRVASTQLATGRDPLRRNCRYRRNVDQVSAVDAARFARVGNRCHARWLEIVEDIGL
jgi:hypothetical protein